jgi:hypothetical protein
MEWLRTTTNRDNDRSYDPVQLLGTCYGKGGTCPDTCKERPAILVRSLSQTEVYGPCTCGLAMSHRFMIVLSYFRAGGVTPSCAPPVPKAPPPPPRTASVTSPCLLQSSLFCSVVSETPLRDEWILCTDSCQSPGRACLFAQSSLWNSKKLQQHLLVVCLFFTLFAQSFLRWEMLTYFWLESL